MDHIIVDKNKLKYAYYLHNGDYLFGEPRYDVYGNGLMIATGQSKKDISNWKRKIRREKLNINITEIKTKYPAPAPYVPSETDKLNIPF